MTYSFPDQTIPITMIDQATRQIQIDYTVLSEPSNHTSTVEVSLDNFPSVTQSFDIQINFSCQVCSIDLDESVETGVTHTYRLGDAPLEIPLSYTVYMEDCGHEKTFKLELDGQLISANDPLFHLNYATQTISIESELSDATVTKYPQGKYELTVELSVDSVENTEFKVYIEVISDAQWFTVGGGPIFLDEIEIIDYELAIGDSLSIQLP